MLTGCWGRQSAQKVVTEERCQVHPRERSLLYTLCNSKWRSTTNQLVFPLSEIQREHPIDQSELQTTQLEGDIAAIFAFCMPADIKLIFDRSLLVGLDGDTEHFQTSN